MAKDTKKRSKVEDAAGYFIGGGSAVGIGLGFLYNELVAGAVLGAGIGLLLSAFLVLFAKKD